MERILVVVVLLTVVNLTFAHHSTAPHFHMDQEMVMENAIVRDMKLVNPHSYVYIDVAEQAGESVAWRCEMTSRTRLLRGGWTDKTVTRGQLVTIIGSPARREDNLCHILEMTLSDGTQVIQRRGVADSSNALSPRSEPKAVALKREPYLPNGQPNLQGSWIAPSRNRNIALPALTEAGALAAKGYIFEFDNPALFCHPSSIVFAWDFAAEINEILQDGDQITLQYGYMDLIRTVKLNLSEHPNDIVPSVGGHSIGWWEEDTLVVDTVGFESGVLSPLERGRHVMNSDQLHVVERFKLGPDGQSLLRTYSATDPEYFIGSFAGENVLIPSLDNYAPYNCIELSGKNNQRPDR